MSRIFLSYSREDAACAEGLAKALERAGYEVWWDRHIHGGSRFAQEINQALSNAEAVVVLWSPSSIESAWVQDEAAEGRDSDRLVPVLIDKSKPPLGFRQYQSIDLSGWSDRRKLPQALIAALDAKAKTASSPSGAAPVQERRRSRPALPAVAAVISLLVAAALVFAGWSYFSPKPASAETPTLAVLPFADLSPAGDKAYFAEGVAESILSLLGRESGIRVIGRTSASMFKSGATDLAAIRSALGVTHVLEGSARTSGDDLRMSVRLVDASDGTQVWAEDYQRELSNVFAVQDEIGRAVASRLVGTLSSSGLNQTQTTKADAYDLYLAARAKMRDRKEPALREALALARRVLAADPAYAPGHALYAELIWLLSDAPAAYGSIPQDKARAAALVHARKAVALAPTSPDGYAALGLVAPPEEAVHALSRAIRLDPARSELRVWLAYAFEALGRNEEALRELQAAVAIDPLWTVPINRLKNVLAANGRIKEAERVVQTYSERGGEPAQAARFRSVNARRSGDLSEAVRLAMIARSLDPEVPYVESYLEDYAAMLELPQLVTWQPVRNRLFSWLNAKGNDDRLVAEAKRAASALWARSDATIAILALAENRSWPQLEVVHDAAARAAPGICGRPVEAILPLAQALHYRGRTQEAARALGCAQQQIAAQARGRTRSEDLDRAALPFARAQVFALSGRHQSALGALDEAIQAGWRGYPYSAKLASYPGLDALRSTAQYSRIQQRLDQVIAAERQQVLLDLKSGQTSS
jgi:adenylate cyclase